MVGSIDLPLWVLFVRFTTVTYRLGSQLDEAVVQLAMGPVVLWIRGVSEAKRRKSHLLQTAWAQPSTSDGFPELLAVGRQIALARGGDCDENDLVV